MIRTRIARTVAVAFLGLLALGAAVVTQAPASLAHSIPASEAHSTFASEAHSRPADISWGG
ncbi:hypothetical protein ABZ858_23990 [Streptomyces sp. NPDC047017]|uniref:hypothetical protein n=1 Tax=Streptomyces sp. NPDC047017 TaxID=3155024 RepID=UPI0033FC5CD8